MNMQHTLGGIEKQLENLDKKMDKISADVEKHGRWVYAANAIGVIVLAVISFLASKIWDLLIATRH